MPDRPVADKPAASYHQIQDESPTVDSAVKNITDEFTSNKNKHGDACAAYAQMASEVYAFEQKNGADKTKQFVGEVTSHLPKQFGPAMEVAALRFVKEYEGYKKQNQQLDKNDPLMKIQEDPFVKSLNQALIAGLPEDVQRQTPEQLGQTVQKIKDSIASTDSNANPQEPTDSKLPKQQSPEAIQKDTEQAKKFFEQMSAKSPALAGLYDRWQHTPYTQSDVNHPEQGQILLKNDSTDVIYNSAKGQLIIGAPTEEGLKGSHPELNDQQRKSIIDNQANVLPELVAHQMYTATHQSLDVLFGNSQPVSKEQYVDTRLTNTAGAYLAEIEVNRELGRKEPVAFSYKDSNGTVQSENLSQLAAFSDAGNKTIDEAKSIDKIKDFLVNFHREDQPPLKFDNQFAGEYDQYTANFEANRAELTKRGFVGATKGN
ncbi:hypothetical protein BH10CYA1_BH10CYA1_53360 [soil metagenome]